MKVSIIIPVYNAEKYLEECLLSALAQTYTDTEIIAINDGSTDRSIEILKKYDGRIRIIQKAQGGVASARNEGIKISSGEWIKLLDNDDVLYPHAIEELIAAASSIEKENIILYTNADYIDSQSKIIGYLDEPNYNFLKTFDRNVILLDHNIGIPSTWLIHKSVLMRCGLFDELTQHDDYEYHLRACLLFESNFHLVEKRLIKYRFHAQQFTWHVMRKFQNQDTIVLKILNKLDPTEKEKYYQALMQFRSSRTFFEKTAHLIKPVLKYLPIRLEIKLRTAYLKIVEYRKAKI